MTDETVSGSSELAKTSDVETKETVDELPEGTDTLTRQQAMRKLGVGSTRFAELVAAGELHSWRRGREVLVDKAEVEAMAEVGGGAATIQKTYTAIIKQTQDHQERTMRLAEEGLGTIVQVAKEFGSQTASVIRYLVEQNRALETKLDDLRHKAVELEVKETEQQLEVIERTVAAEQRHAMIDAAKTAFPVLVARFGAKSPDLNTRDAALVAAVRAVAKDEDLVAKLTAALPPEQAGLIATLVDAAKESEPEKKG